MSSCSRRSESCRFRRERRQAVFFEKTESVLVIDIDERQGQWVGPAFCTSAPRIGLGSENSNPVVRALDCCARHTGGHARAWLHSAECLGVSL